jgi:hypothetical protein
VSEGDGRGERQLPNGRGVLRCINTWRIVMEEQIGEDVADYIRLRDELVAERAATPDWRELVGGW